ncbi:MAG: cytochrome c oxidase subunit 3 family protein [Terriglobales bacterium]
MHDSAITAQHDLRHHFADLEQQRASATLGMWVFLVTEIMFFGGLFAGYVVYRTTHYDAWLIGSEHMEFWIGTINTVILLCSSLLVALAVHASQVGRGRTCAVYLWIASVMGVAFLALKGFEYHAHFVEGAVPGAFWKLAVADPRSVQMFFYIYFVMTGLHAIHVTIGVVLLAVIGWFAAKGRYSPAYHNPVHVSGLYWHFVDVVWIFLYPLLYLIGHKKA